MGLKLKIVCVVFLLMIFLVVPTGADNTEYITKDSENLKDFYEIKQKYDINGENYYVFTINSSNKTSSPKVSSLAEGNKNIVKNKIVKSHRLKTNNDFNFNIEMIKAKEVIPKSEYDDINVAVLDTGVSEHENLNSVEWESNTLSLNNNPEDKNGHGTHVAGIVAATHNSSSGVRGVAPEIDIYDIKVLNDDGTGKLSDLATGIRRAAEGPDGVTGTEDDADVISMSLGVEERFLIDDVIEDVPPSSVVVASAGNDGNIEYPAKFEDTISVANVNKKAEPFFFSNAEGEENTVAAPGVDIKSLDNKGGFIKMSGTSMAAPHVSGAVAMYLSKYDTNSTVTKRVLEETAVDVHKPGFDEATGHGLLNVKSLLKTSPKPRIESISVKDDLRVSFETITFRTNTKFYKLVSPVGVKNNDNFDRIECCEFNINRSELEKKNLKSVSIEVKAKNKWGNHTKRIIYDIKQNKSNIVKSIRKDGENPNKIERESLEDAVFEFTAGNKKFNGVELTRNGIQEAVFEFVTA